MIQIVPIDTKDIDDTVEFVDPIIKREDIKDIIDGSVCFSVLYNGEFSGCGGISPVNNTWEIWMALPKKTKANKFNIIIAVKECLGILRDSVEQELVSHVAKGFRKGEKLVKFLGFEKNGEVEIGGIPYTEYILWQQ